MESDSCSQELKDACSFMLDHMEIFSQIDNSISGGNQDGMISETDLENYLLSLTNSEDNQGTKITPLGSQQK